jgi:hypothetical protein
MAFFLRSPFEKSKTIVKFRISRIYNQRYIFGSFDNNGIPELFKAGYMINEQGTLIKINPKDLYWFHYEDVNKMLIFDHFHLPHYTKEGDTLLYLE